MQTGDVVFFKAQNTRVSRWISRVTKSEYTHVGLALDDKTIIEANRFINTRIVSFVLDETQHVLFRLPNVDDTMKEKIHAEAMRFERFPYDYLHVLKLYVHLVFGYECSFLIRGNRTICSKLIDFAFFASGTPRKTRGRIGDITPSMLIELYELEEVAGVQHGTKEVHCIEIVIESGGVS